MKTRRKVRQKTQVPAVINAIWAIGVSILSRTGVDVFRERAKEEERNPNDGISKARTHREFIVESKEAGLQAPHSIQRKIDGDGNQNNESVGSHSPFSGEDDKSC